MTMTIPFLNFFKKVKDQALVKKEQPVAGQPVLPVEKPSSERLSKTVMPNATRALPTQDSFAMAARPPAIGGPVPGAGAVASAASASRTISFGAGAPPLGRPGDLPPAVALALEPMVERVIALELADIAAQIPADYIKPIESIDGSRRILLKACEVERGMASKKPAISLATVYQQVPEIFLRSIAPSDAMQVQLPFEKVLEQFASLQVRSDQDRHQAVPQVETPFLKVTLEDNSRFGTTTEVVEISDLPPVRIQPATAEAFAAAEPETAGNGFVRYGSENPSTMPTRISLEISPNGTGGPASESVPASSGPSVPTSLPSATAPVRIPFKLRVPGDDLEPKNEPWLTPEKSETPIAPSKTSEAEAKITLALKPILKGLPPSQLSGDVDSVPSEAQVELPFSLIESQLAVGRIIVTPEVLVAAMPVEYRSLIKDGEVADVLLPLHEVLKNLPSASLRMREDQEEQEAGVNIATPFSAKAEEDAKRFSTAGATAATLPVTPPMAVEEAQTAAAPTGELLDSPPSNPSQVAPETDDKLDDKEVVAHVNKLAGVKGCALIFSDGLSLAGSLPAEYETEGLCAMAPSLMQRIEKHMVETKLGGLRSMTLSGMKGAVTFFTHENLCLAVLHTSGDLASEVQEELTGVVQELSRKYSHPA
jgi:predicted regulator of Ras-like GTPase activity (Roadblock/LC7/MglB family)